MSKVTLFEPDSLFDSSKQTVPTHTQDSIEDYLLRGCHPGGFLEAVLANDLFRAIKGADHINKQAIAVITTWIYTHAPYGSYGSHEMIESWLADTNGLRTSYTNKLEKELVWKKLNE